MKSNGAEMMLVNDDADRMKAQSTKNKVEQRKKEKRALERYLCVLGPRKVWKHTP